MEVSKFLYFALLNFNLRLFTLWTSILFHDQFTDSLLHCLYSVLVKCEVSLDWMMSEAFQCYRQNRRTAKSGDVTIPLLKLTLIKVLLISSRRKSTNLSIFCLKNRLKFNIMVRLQYYEVLINFDSQELK